jgi:chromosomal replication initiator protein
MPVVLYGPSGTGKTSLAMAMVSKFMDTVDSQQTPIFVSGSDFARRFYAAIETNCVDEFREKFLLASAIIIDNLQQLVNKLPAQKELSSLVETCCQTGKPLFITCPSLPIAIDGIDGRLSSRLAGGLSLPLNPPGHIARLAIIKELAVIHDVRLSDDAINLLTDRFEVTVPKLQHLFQQIKLKFKVDQQSSLIDGPSLMALLRPGEEDQQKMIRLIQKRVAKEFGLKLSDLKSGSRKQTVVLARGVGIFLTRTLLGTSFVKIGHAFGNRDHSTVLHAFQKIGSLYSQGSAIDNDSGAAGTSATNYSTSHRSATISTIDSLKQRLTDLFAAQIYQT